MKEKSLITPDYVFETSWEVCNKVGGIHTVLRTKAPRMVDKYGENYIVIGPDVWKKTDQNPDFEEDPHLLKEWKIKAHAAGLNIRTGYWKVPGRPIAILIDFTPYFSQKDKIFTYLWETSRLDSIHGQWDYIEPALFGYKAGKVIEHFCKYHTNVEDRVVTHFHEWTSGAGVLYIKKNFPQAGCVFTTHMTVLGNAASRHGIPLYTDMETINPDELAKKTGVISQFSLERIAANEADCLTTVSEVTAKECQKLLGRQPDVITINGFDRSLIPDDTEYPEKRDAARKKLNGAAGQLLGHEISADAFHIMTSGRYEIRIKGIDVFIEALQRLDQDNKTDRDVIAWIWVPAKHTGPAKQFLPSAAGKEKTGDEPHTTHELYDPAGDPILNLLKKANLQNKPGNRVRVIFVPSYLNGHDGVFNANYYDLLPGFDLTVFPSYYESWGYTPLESIAFKVPTVTSSLSGFGNWAKQLGSVEDTGVFVVERNDNNIEQAVSATYSAIASVLQDQVSTEQLSGKALETAKKLMWDELIANYEKGYSCVLEKVEQRSELFRSKKKIEYTSISNGTNAEPVWRKVLINPKIPAKLEKLQELSKNLWWSWNAEAIDLFQSVHPRLWEEYYHNPVKLLESLSYENLKKLESDKGFISKLNNVYKKYRTYMDRPSRNTPKVAYFSMEFGLHHTLKIYSGGLGVLAGDYLKEASDSNYDITGIGLLYRYGYFQQSISLFGDQTAEYIPQKFSHLPLVPVRKKDGTWMTVSIAFPGRNLTAKVWKVMVGKVPLYLMDTDIDENTSQDRSITHQLYGGDKENRLKQELLLGIGGIRLLNELEAGPDLYHCNEGHAAFIGIERIADLIFDKKLSFNQAHEMVRATTLFTTHTPVPAGHDHFSEDMIRTYLSHYAENLNLSWNAFMELGRLRPNNEFSMSILATNMSQEVNAVSKLHESVTRKMFSELYKGYFPEELYIGHVTNGVHLPTWASSRWKALYSEALGKDFLEKQTDPELWARIKEVPDAEIWKLRQESKKDLIEYLRKKLTAEMTMRQENPKTIFRVMESLEDNALIIGFARRFATYKRAQLMFSNLDRLKVLVNDPERPMRFLFAGKAHPADEAGQGLIKRIIEVSKMPDFMGKIIFVENYNMMVGKKMVQGVDLWLNTPTRLMEASGTSGEKAILNGVANFSVLDGWWAEGYRPGAGFAIDEAKTYANQVFQDELDAEIIYNIIEDEILPAYFTRNKAGIPEKWTPVIKNTIAEIAPHFNMRRMLNDYDRKFYTKLMERSQTLVGKNYEQLRHLTNWKKKVHREWDRVEVVSVEVPDSTKQPLMLGEVFSAKVVLKTGALEGEDIGVEVIFGSKVNDRVEEIVRLEELEIVRKNKDQTTWYCEIPAQRTGVYDYSFRIYPKNSLLPHRQDFRLVKWI